MQISERDFAKEMFSLLDLLVPDFSGRPDGLYVDRVNFIRVEPHHRGSKDFSKVLLLRELYGVVAHFFHIFEAYVGRVGGEELVNLIQEILASYIELVRLDNFVNVQICLGVFVPELLKKYFEGVRTQISVGCLLSLLKLDIFFLFLELMKAYFERLQFFLFPFRQLSVFYFPEPNLIMLFNHFDNFISLVLFIFSLCFARKIEIIFWHKDWKAIRMKNGVVLAGAVQEEVWNLRGIHQ